MPAIPFVLASSSPLILSRLQRELGALPQLQACGQAGDLSGTYVLAEQREPKLVILGTELVRHPEFDGLLAMFRVMGIRWMRLASDLAVSGAAAQAPVLDPTLPGPALLQRIEAAMAQPATGKTAPGLPSVPKPAAPNGLRGRADRFVLIGSSTGGIDALLRVLSTFPADCPPTAIVQHTGAAFSDSLIRLLDRCCAANVVPARSGLVLQPGTVVVGAGCAGHLRLSPGTPPRTQVQPGDPVSGHLPSVDELFRSAVPFARSVICALLTGMGRDGAQGMLALREAGATTIAQDEATSVVYGMPARRGRWGRRKCGCRSTASARNCWPAAPSARPRVRRDDRGGHADRAGGAGRVPGVVPARRDSVNHSRLLRGRLHLGRRRGIGGMNHFLLAQAQGPSAVKDNRYGVHAMEMLINGLLRAGARRDALRAKLFGGAKIAANLRDIGASNAEFAREFLRIEGIPCVAESLGGIQARRVTFVPTTGRARQLLIPNDAVQEPVARPLPVRPAATPAIELF